MAEASPCLATPGVTSIHFLIPVQTIELHHHEREGVPPVSRFRVDGKEYYWNGHSELIKVEGGDLLAEFFPSWTIVDVQEHKLGKLTVRDEGKRLLDIVVVTALVVMERSDEARQAVTRLSDFSDV